MSIDNNLYQRSILVNLGKSFLGTCERILPKSIYNYVYSFTFSTYKKLVHIYYWRHVLSAKLRRSDEQYRKAKTISRIMPYSLVGESGLTTTYDLATEIEKRGYIGAFVECGVARGGVSAMMGLVIKWHKSKRDLWMFDSYEGLPEPTEKDIESGVTGHHARPLPVGSCLGTYEEVQRLMFETMALKSESIHMVKGWFEETLAPNAAQIGAISVLRIDADWYESVMCCLDTLYPQVISNGFVIIDDYGTCFGAKKAVDEFLDKNGIQVTLTHDGRGGCYFTKPQQNVVRVEER